MTDTQQAKALHLLYSQLKKARIDLGHAERRQNNWDERENLARKIDTLEWIIGVVTKEDEL